MDKNISGIVRTVGSLDAKERSTLKALSTTGAAIPAELAVKTFSLPEEANEVIRSLRDKELVDTERGTRGTSLSKGEVIYLNERGRMAVEYLRETGEL